MLQTDLDTNGVNEGNSGINQTWNFGSANPSGTSLLLQYVNPSTTPYATNFPSATVTLDLTSTGFGNYSYYETSSNQTQLLGYFLNDGVNDYMYYYSNPQTVMSYPFTYNTAVTDLFARTLSVTFGGVTVEMHRYGSTTITGDGYGTVITPAGTFNNVLRTVTIENSTDSNVYVGFPIPAEISHNKITTWNWISPLANGVVFTIVTDSTVDGSGTYSFDKKTFYTSITTGIEHKKEPTILSAYPNPAKNYSTISFSPRHSGNAQVEVFDNSGKRIAYWNIEATAEQSQLLRINLLSEPAGLYQVRIVQGNEVFTSRIMKQ